MFLCKVKGIYGFFVIQVDHIEIPSDFIGPFIRLRLSFDSFHQEVETHVEDLLNTEFMNVFQELYVSEDNKSVQIQVQNLRKTWTYRGILDILNVDEGEFCQIVNVLLNKVMSLDNINQMISI